MRINDSLRFPARDAAERAAKALAEEGYAVTLTRAQMQQLADDLGGDFPPRD